MDQKQYVGTFHSTEKIDNMLTQMFNHPDPYRLVYKWMHERNLSFKEFMELMKTYERYVRN